ncbi:MAG: AAA family ATPase [Desulfonatronovibrionaceae bacterium]
MFKANLSLYHLQTGNTPLALEGLQGLVVIDEVQRASGLFEVLRVLVDRRDNPARFLILGSASRDLSLPAGNPGQRGPDVPPQARPFLGGLCH